MTATDDWFLQSKLRPPRIPGDTVDRPRLSALTLGPAEARAVLVSAPAGFGKSTLLTQVHARFTADGITAAWVQLDEHDRHPQRLAAAMMMALREAGGDFVPAHSYASDPTADADDLLRRLIAVITEQGRPVALFLDDIHRCQSTGSARLLQALLDRQPENLSLFLSSRVRPGLRLAQHHATGRLVNLDHHALRFSCQEAGSLFGNVLDGKELGLLVQRTEGWAVSLRLARLWMARATASDGDSVARFTGRSSNMAEYFAEEILQELPPERQDFLMRTSILERISGEVAAELTGMAGSGAILDELERRDLLLIPVDADRNWYRYHNVLSDFLRDRLRRLHGAAAVKALHRKAACWFAAMGLMADSVHHARAAGDEELALDLVERAGGWRLALRGGMHGLRSLEGLGAGRLAEFPRARLGQIYLLAQDGHVAQARAAFAELDHATGGFRSGTDTARLFAESRAVESILRIYEDRPVSLADVMMLDDIVQREGPGPGDLHLQVTLTSLRIIALFDAGDYRAVTRDGEQAALGQRQRGAPYAEIYLYAYIGLAYLFTGAVQQARTAFRTMLDRASSVYGPDSNQATTARLLLGAALYDAGEAADAAAMCLPALDGADRLDAWFEVYAAGYLTAAGLAADAGDTPGALDILGQGLVTARRRGLGRLETLLSIARIDLLAASGELAAARAAHEAIRPHLVFEGAPLRLTAPRIFAHARLLLAEGQAVPALAEVEALLPLLHHAGLRQWEVRARLLRAAILDDLGRPAEAGEERVAAEAVADGQPMRGIVRPRPAANGGPAGSVPPTPLPGGLSAREWEVVEELSGGLSNKEIARRLGITEGTVKNHRKNIYRKLGTSSRSRIVALVQGGG